MGISTISHHRQNNVSNRRLAATCFAALVTVLFALFSGCSAFQGSKRIDLGPFADNTSAMFADAQKVARPLTWVYLKPYQNAPEVSGFREAAAPILKTLRSVLLYSNQLVALASADLSVKEKNDRLASYLSEATKVAVISGKMAEIGVSSPTLDSVLINIRKSESFLDAIGAAAPLVNAIVASMDQNLRELQDASATVMRSLDQKIDAEFADSRQNLVNLTRLQNQFLREATLLYDYKLGNGASLDSITLADASMKQVVAAAGKKNSNVADTIERELGERAARLRTYLDQLEPEITLYHAKQKELEEMRVSVESRIKMARAAMMVWGQSHRNLGDGIPVPPMIDITGTVSGLIGGATKSVVP